MALLDNITVFQLELAENEAPVLLTIVEKMPGLGSWPLLVRWFGGAIQGYIDDYV
jgi:hypothetical protein